MTEKKSNGNNKDKSLLMRFFIKLRYRVNPP
jgi:hypothetical protein